MTSYFKAIYAILKKDLMVEFRTKESINSMAVFGLLTVTVFSFILDPSSDSKIEVAGGIFWIAIIFSGLLGLGKSMLNEVNGGNFEAILLAPVDSTSIFFGKFIANMTSMFLLEIIILPIFSVFYSINILSHPLMLLILFLTTYAFSLLGTLFSVISVKSRSREAMLPLLLLPILIPVILAAILSTNIFVAGDDIVGSYNWIKILSVFNIIFTTVIFVIFPSIVEE